MKFMIFNLILSPLLVLFSQSACAQSGLQKNAVTKESESDACAPCKEAWAKKQVVVARIEKEQLKPDFGDKKTIAQQRQVKFEIAKILADF
jgi:hypothetical protein